ncbi:MAG: hypothetical protein IKB08_08865 [Clostridia bacterium]|nr:hypothetical protein [Clostridia bacterium]
MKKNALRVLALALVASMLFAFASCTQEIHVRFVDKDGNDIDISGLGFGSVQTGTDTQPNNPAPQNPSQEETTAAPQNPSQEATTAAPQQGETTTAAPQQGDATTAAPQQGNKMPATTKEITDFYKKGVDDIKAGKAGYIKKEWQNVDAVNIGGSLVNSAVTGVLGSFMTTEDEAGEQDCAKGSDEAKNRIAAWTLTDLSKVKSATCVADGSNYKITIIMHDEDTPKKQGSVLGQVTGALLYWEDIETTLTTDPTVTKILTGFSGIHVIYKGYKIEATMTPDGKFISIDHTADVDIIIGEAKIIGISIKDKSGHMWNYCKFYNFKY